MPKKTMKTKRSSSSKKTPSGTKAKKDVKAFVDHVETSKEMGEHLKKGWDKVIAAGKKKGFKFTRQELRDHFKERYGVKSSSSDDDPNTCFCI